jgi:hypothetical protein
MRTHSCVIAPHLKAPLAHGAPGGKYGRMFPHLPALQIDEGVLRALGGALMQPVTAAADPADDNPRIPAGFAILGQFIAHDLTRDPSLLHHHASIGELRNFRAPRLDLEVVYGAGPLANPYFFDLRDPDKFLIGVNDAGQPYDVPRNAQGQALIADPRNDVHMIISQLHLAFLKFHNRIVDELRAQAAAGETLFDQARRIATWHYQWIVVHEFLSLTVGEDLVAEILHRGPSAYVFKGAPSIPVEFADAAYRFGHPQIRETYRLNDRTEGARIFPDLAGTKPVPAAYAIEWKHFFNIPGQPPAQPSRRIRASLAPALGSLSEAIVGKTDVPEEHSLAYRDLERGISCGLPSGESIARALGLTPVSAEDLGLRALGWAGETPLWYYVLQEASAQARGERLGDVGGRIVAEVLIGLLQADPAAYQNVSPDWRPTLPASRAGEFTMADLLEWA